MIFVDTSLWVGLLLPRDAHHEEARQLLHRHAEDNVVTSNHVRGETWTFLRPRAGHRVAVTFLDRLERSPRLRNLHVPEGLKEQAPRWLRQHGEAIYSFVDATSFMLMRSLRISQALTFDEDFAAAGFQVLRAR